jgi:hypothetical protein
MNAWKRLLYISSLMTLCAACGGGGGGGNGAPPPPPQPQPPAAPVIEITSIGVSQIWLDWPAVAGATEYRIYFATQAGVTPQNYNTLPNSGMDITAAPPDNVWLALESELYYVVVTAFNKNGESAPSNELSVRPWGEVTDATFRPSERALMPGASQWFVLDGTVTGGQFRNVTERATWTSSDPGVVSIGPYNEGSQFVTGESPGQATITATVDGLVLDADVRVWPIVQLEGVVPAAIGATVPTIGIDDAGNALAAWAYHLEGELRVYAYTPAGGWSGPTLLDSQGDRVEEPMLAVAGSGRAHMAWYGLDGVYSAEYIPAQGWLATEKISAIGQEIQVAIGADGNGVAIWLDPNNNTIMTSSFTSGAGWSAPTALAQREFSQAAYRLVANDSGTTVATWESWSMTPGDSWTLHAAIYEPGSGWGAPQILIQQTVYSGPHSDIAEDGTIVVVWLDGGVSEGANLSLYKPGTGWLPNEVVRAEIAARHPRAAIFDGGHVMVTWSGAGNYNFYARLRDPAGNWSAMETLVDTAFGGRAPHLVRNSSGGVTHIEVGARTVVDMPWARVHRYHTSTGWQEEEILHAGIGQMAPSAISRSPAGHVIFGWNEHYSLFDGAVFQNYEDLLVLVDP